MINNMYGGFALNQIGANTQLTQINFHEVSSPFTHLIFILIQSIIIFNLFKLIAFIIPCKLKPFN